MKTLPRIGLVAMIIATLACNASSQDTSDQAGKQSADKSASSSSHETQPGLLGTVQRITDIVEHGATAETIERVIDEVNLFAGDVLRVRDGGEGLMVFPDGMLLRLFNDTALNITVVESDPGSPIDVQMFLEDGGFTGEFTAEGGSAVFETPGGAEITILVADFFVTYDAASHFTLVGNFGGQVEVTGAGQSLTLADGEFVEVPDGGPPGQPLPMTVDQEEFEAAARTEESAVAAAANLGPSQWVFEMSYAQDTFNDVQGASETTGTWTGEFEVSSDGQISGQGEAAFTHYTECGPGAGIGETLTGEFPFELTGERVGDPGTGGSFAIDVISGEASTESDRPSFCYLIPEGVARLVTFVTGLGSDLVIERRDGSTASFSVLYWLTEEPSSGEVSIGILSDQ